MALSSWAYWSASRLPRDRESLRQSVTGFGKEYRALAALAKSLATSTRALMRRSAEAGINLLYVPVNRRAGPQPFMRREDMAIFM
jgi:hypothetical protein